MLNLKHIHTFVFTTKAGSLKEAARQLFIHWKSRDP